MLGQRIRSRRAALRMTQGQLGQRLDIGKSSISEWEHGKRAPSVEDLDAIARALDTTPEYLMGWTDDASPLGYDGLIRAPKRVRVPLLGAIACGEPIFDPEQDAEAESDVPCDCALYCKGDSMVGARIHDGDLVFIRLQSDVEDGQIAAVAVDGEMTLKRVYKLRDVDDEGNVVCRVELRAENPRYAPIRIGGNGETRNAAIIGRAVAVRFQV